MRDLADTCRLANGEATVAELIAHVGLSQPLVSWHLARLRTAGIGSNLLH